MGHERTRDVDGLQWRGPPGCPTARGSQWVSFQSIASSRSRSCSGCAMSASLTQPQALATRRWQRLSSALPAAIKKNWIRSRPHRRLPSSRLAATDDAASSVCLACRALRRRTRATTLNEPRRFEWRVTGGAACGGATRQRGAFSFRPRATTVNKPTTPSPHRQLACARITGQLAPPPCQDGRRTHSDSDSGSGSDTDSGSGADSGLGLGVGHGHRLGLGRGHGREAGAPHGRPM